MPAMDESRVSGILKKNYPEWGKKAFTFFIRSVDVLLWVAGLVEYVRYEIIFPFHCTSRSSKTISMHAGIFTSSFFHSGNKIKGLLSTLCLCCSLSEVSGQLYVGSSSTLYVQTQDFLFATGDVENNGTISRITLTGSSSQALSGSGTIQHLKVNKSSGTASIATGSNQSITETLDLTSGILASNASLTLKSSATGSARVLSHTASGSLTGVVTVEKYIDVAGRPHQWRTLGFPYGADIALSAVSGFAVDYTAGSKSIMYFNEGADDGAYGASGSRNAGYVSYSAATETIPAGRGVMAWLYGNAGGRASSGTMSGGLTIVSSGTLNESGSAVSLPVTYNPTPVNPANRGWNLVSNPFVSNIDWNSADIVKTRISNTIYRWNPLSASWTTYNGLTGAPANVDQYIEAGTSFFVKATDASPVLTIPQSAKTATSSGFIHAQRAPRISAIPGEKVSSDNGLAGIRLVIQGQGNPYPDEAYLDLSRSDASAGFDSRYDAVSMDRSSGPGVGVLGKDGRSFTLQFDLPLNETSAEARYYPLRITAPFKGEHHIIVKPEGRWDSRHSVALIDKVSNKTLLLRQDSLKYVFTPESTKLDNRFVLAINHVRVSDPSATETAEMKILGNPVSGSKLNFSFFSPNAMPRRWRVLNMSGQQLAEGQLYSESLNIQYQVLLPSSIISGSYILVVETASGDLWQERFIKQ